MNRVGIIGGTFNPIHYGHLFIAEEVRLAFGISKVIFVPNCLPPHRSNIDLMNPEHRWNMINLAISSNPFFEGSRFEIEENRESYSVYTVKYFYENLRDSSICFITGVDALLNYYWRNFEEIMNMLELFVAVSRPGYSEELFKNKVSQYYSSYSQKISIFNTILLDISSSNIRDRIRTGKNIKYLIPEGVEKYILEHKLYMD